MLLEPKKVSVVIVCNSDRFLPQTIASIEAQTYNHNQIEIILVLDRLEINEVSAKISNITNIKLKVFKSKTKGVVAGTNTAIRKASGNYISIIDSDDLMYPNRIEHQIQFLENNSNVVAVGGHIDFIDKQSRYLREKKYRTSPNDIRKNIFEMAQLAHPATTYRKNFILDIGGYRELSAPDIDLWIRILENGGKIANLNEKVIRYRLHENNYSKNKVFLTNIPRKILWISHFLRVNGVSHNLPHYGFETKWIDNYKKILNLGFVEQLALSNYWNLSEEFMHELHFLKTGTRKQKLITVINLIVHFKAETFKRAQLKISRLLYICFLYRKHKWKVKNSKLN